MSEPFEVYDNIKPDYEAEGFMDKRDFKEEWENEIKKGDGIPAQPPPEWIDEMLDTIDKMSETISKQDEIIQNYRDRIIKLVEQRDRTERVYDEIKELKEYLSILDENDWWLRHEIDERDEEIDRLDEQINYWKRSFEHQEEALHDYENNMNDVIEKLRTELDEKDEEIERLKTETLQIEGTAKLMYKYKQERDEAIFALIDQKKMYLKEIDRLKKELGYFVEQSFWCEKERDERFSMEEIQHAIIKIYDGMEEYWKNDWKNINEILLKSRSKEND